jgi:hypothetical protein
MNSLRMVLRAISQRMIFQLFLLSIARLAQSAERKALNLVVVGSSPTVGVLRGCPKSSFLNVEHSAFYRQFNGNPVAIHWISF